MMSKSAKRYSGARTKLLTMMDQVPSIIDYCNWSRSIATAKIVGLVAEDPVASALKQAFLASVNAILDVNVTINHKL